MTAFPEMIRNVAIVGHLHHGKTALMDMLVFETHRLIWDADKPVREQTVWLEPHSLLHIDALHRHTHFVTRAPNLNQILSHVFDPL